MAKDTLPALPPRVVLTGFMGTGKSAVGRALARKLGYDWVDTDDLIESRHGPVDQIFSSDGEEAFRELEAAVAAELAGRNSLVISTGGRLMLDPENAARLGKHSRVFCLVAQPDELLRRIGAGGGPIRPLLTDPHPAERIVQLLAERAAGYAHFEQVVTDEHSVDQVVDEIITRLTVAG